MSEARSILNGATFEGAIKITETGLRGMITLRGDLSGSALQKAVKSATGAALPEVRKITFGKAGNVAWMSPDELLLIVDYATVDTVVKSLGKALKGEHHMAVNVSDARAVFQLTGKGAREVLAKGAPVDLSPAAFGTGDLRRTRIGQLAAAFWMLKDGTIEVVCFRSVGEFLFDWLSNAAEQDSLPGYF
ncbi:MAG: sarcosine oxidase subunit gamma family protein [Paracoccaceae bacterium]